MTYTFLYLKVLVKSLVKYGYNLLEDIKFKNGIRFFGKKDISAMKLMAIANRGDQAKDFIDIYYLLEEISLY
jgi:hypothetical protein